MGLGDRLQHAWDAFFNKDPTRIQYVNIGPGYSRKPDRTQLAYSKDRTIINAILTRMAVDAASIDIRHVRLDENDRFFEYIESGLDRCLTLEANIDQSGREFKRDVYMSLLDEGSIAIIPVETTGPDPRYSTSYEINTLRTAKILEWYPKHVRVKAYNQKKGKKEELVLPKSMVAIAENPFYSVMNEPNSIMQRMIKKLNLLDVVDDQVSSNKLNMVVQLPYSVKAPSKRNLAQERVKDLEEQLINSPYGIAYIDGTEKITQINRPLENNLIAHIEYLQNLLYSQLGITQSILDGTADEKVMLNYNTRTIEPIVGAIVDAIKRTFLSKTAISQGQSIMAFREPFKLVPVNNIAEIADKFTRNEIMTSNEIRQIIGMKPSDDPKADQLVNSNIAQPNDQPVMPEMDPNAQQYYDPNVESYEGEG